MVNTRGNENNLLERKLKAVQRNLDRSERKLQIILNWIRESFGEANFLFDELWKILREFDEESKIVEAKLSRPSTTTTLGHDPVASKAPSSNLNKNIRITDVQSIAAKSNAVRRLIPTNLKSGKVGQMAYVLVESLDLGTASLTPIPISQRVRHNYVQSVSERKDMSTREEPRRTRKLSHKLLTAQMNGDEVEISNRNLSAHGDNEHSLDMDSDPLRLSNPPSPGSSNSIYEPNLDDVENVDESDLKENLISETVPDTPGSSSESRSTPLYSCTNCDKKFVTSRSFAKHQLVHDVLKSGQDLKFETYSSPDPDHADPDPISPTSSIVVPRFNKLLKRRILEPEPTTSKKRARKMTIVKVPRPPAQSRLPRPDIVKRKPGRKKLPPKPPLICEVCGNTLKSPSSLKHHMQLQHGDEPRETFPCTVCEKVLGSKVTFTNHMKLHSGIKPCLCNICGKTFARALTLNIHMQIHSEDKPFKCSYCNLGFKQKNGLMVHINRHLGRLVKYCPICGLGHAATNGLKRHMNAVHGNVRPHKCHICDKAFKENNHLKYHLKTHDNPNSKKRGLNRELDPQYTAKGSKRGQSGKSRPRIERLGIADEVSFPKGRVYKQSIELVEKIAQERQGDISTSTSTTDHSVDTASTSESEKRTTEPSTTENYEVIDEKDADEVVVDSEDIIDHTWLLNL